MKTKQTGVRFNDDLLQKLIKSGLARSPQTALNLYETSYLELIELKVSLNNQPENKKRILAERNTVAIRPDMNLATPDEFVSKPVHEPKEGSLAYFNKYGVSSKEERENLQGLLP